MEVSENLINVQNNVNIIIYILKMFFLILFAYVTNFKITNKRINEKSKILKNSILIIFITIAYVAIKNEVNYIIRIITLILMISLIFSVDNFGNSILTTIISLSINYAISVIAIIISFTIDKVFNINNDYIFLIIMESLHLIILSAIFKIKKFKHGISFLKENEYMDILVLNISVVILFSVIILVNSDVEFIKNLCVGIVIFAIIMFISIKKSIQLYYKQKLLVQELNETKEELENAKKELKQVEEENLNFSKKSHTLAHRQKSLEHKIQELEEKAKITVEEAGEVKDKLKEIEKDLYEEPATVELRKTEISQIDDMLKYMQSECIENKINFELQLSGNIHYMVNNLISKDDLEILLADHIKDAIIAINHTDNINRSILVKLGEIEGIYSLYIYDSGIEFETETLENLGKKPSTTHADEGGTGMGFMNTFDTLRKYEASLIINELSKPNKDNYTKVLIFKFDKKNEFKIVSYRQSQPR